MGTDGGVVGTGQGFHPPTETEGKQDLSTKARGGTETDTAPSGLEGIFYVLRTGIQWKALPQEYGAAGSIHQYFSEWAEAGFFLRM